MEPFELFGLVFKKYNYTYLIDKNIFTNEFGFKINKIAKRKDIVFKHEAHSKFILVQSSHSNYFDEDDIGKLCTVQVFNFILHRVKESQNKIKELQESIEYHTRITNIDISKYGIFL